MKLKSFKEIGVIALSTFRRFPLVMLTAFVGTIAMIYFVESDYIKHGTTLYFNWQKFVLLCALAIPLMCSISFFSMRKNTKFIYQVILNIIVVIILIGYFFLFENIEAHFIRYALYSISAYLLVLYSPYIREKNEPGFWEFNKMLFFRLLNSALFSFLLYLGLVLAVAAIKELFKVHFSNKIYLDIFVVIAGIFNTWYFLSGVPENLESADRKIEYPKLLKLFSQYILIPLSIVYLLILYAYTIKILVQWQLPIGWTSSLILAYSGIGILAYLLLYPLRRDEENKWAQVFSNTFFKLLFPLIVLMALAVNQRISDYGITEPRYFLIILTIWLFGTALYYTFSKNKNIKVIPVSLMIIALIISIGPWGAFSVSENSQINHVMNILNQNQIIVNGKIVKDIKLKDKDYGNLSSTLYYLQRSHKLNKFISTLKSKSDISFNTPIDSLNYRDVIQTMSIFKQSFTIEDQPKNYDLSDFKMNPLKIEEYDYMVKLNCIAFYRFKTKCFAINNKILKIIFDEKKGKLSIFLADENKDIITYDLKEILNNLSSMNKSDISSYNFMKYSENNKLKVLLLMTQIAYNHSYYGIYTKLYEFSGDIYLKLK